MPTWDLLGNIRGPQGDPGADANPPIAVHFTNPAAQWTVTHNRNSRPDVVLVEDSDPNTPVITDVEYPDLNTVIITWPAPTTGWVYIQ